MGSKNKKDVKDNAEIVAEKADAPADAPIVAEKPADATKEGKISSALNVIKKVAPPVLTAGVVGTAFSYLGLVPTAVAALSKLGLALPVASLATQIAIPAAVGLLAYAAGAVSWMAAKAGYNLVSTAWKKFNRSSKEKYSDELEAIKGIEKNLGLNDSTFAKALDKMLEQAPEASFDEKGAFVDGKPKDGDRASLAHWQFEQLKVVAKAEEAKRNEMLAEVRKGPKPAAAAAPKA